MRCFTAVFASCLCLAVCGGGALAQSPGVDSAPQIGQVSRDSVWVPTPERLIRRMLQLADTARDDRVIDLGSGDGRVPVYAARHFGAHAVGVELEPNLIRVSNERARNEGVADRVQFIQKDLFEADLSQVSVIALYLSPGAMVRLKPRLQALKPGTRIVSHQFTLGDWEADETIQVESRLGYLWVVPADLRGEWKVSMGSDELRMRVDQQHQKLTTRGERAGSPVNIIGARLRGTEIRLTAFD
jgi:SAM-dependent methyltransferase